MQRMDKFSIISVATVTKEQGLPKLPIGDQIGRDKLTSLIYIQASNIYHSEQTGISPELEMDEIMKTGHNHNYVVLIHLIFCPPDSSNFPISKTETVNSSMTYMRYPLSVMPQDTIKVILG